MHDEVQPRPAVHPSKAARLRAVLILIVLEKIVQHFFVSVAFYFDVQGLQSTVVVDPQVLMITGLMVAVLFGLALWGLILNHPRAIDLIIALALFDIFGEFVAQGRVDVAITVSFIVAIALLAVALMFRRQIRWSRPS